MITHNFDDYMRLIRERKTLLGIVETKALRRPDDHPSRTPAKREMLARIAERTKKQIG